jgi:hypothetical protein
MPSLRTIDLMLNNFSGTIPESIYSCRKLTALRLASNKFHGQLSEGLGNLKFLSFLSLTNNRPARHGALTSAPKKQQGFGLQNGAQFLER